jgi:hypothetical protein
MGWSRPIGFQPCNSLWFRSLTWVCSCRWSYILLETLSLFLRSTFSSKSLYGVHSLLRSTFPSNSLYGVHLSRTHTLSLFTEYISFQLSPTEYVSLQLSLRSRSFSNVYTLSLYGVHFLPTLSYGVRFPPTLYGVHLSLSLSLRSTFPSSSLIRSTFPSKPLYGVYFPPTLSTDYIFVQLSTEYLRFAVSVSVSVCLRSTFLLGRALDGVRCRPGTGCQ